MAFIPNVNCIVSVDNDSAVLTDFSDDISMLSYDVSVTNGEFATFGEGWQATPGRRKYAGSFTVRPKTGASSLHNIMMDYLHPGAGVAHGTKTLRVQYPDALAGSFQLDGEVMPDSYKGADQNAEGDGTPANHTFPFKFSIEPTYTLIT